MHDHYLKQYTCICSLKTIVSCTSQKDNFIAHYELPIALCFTSHIRKYVMYMLEGCFFSSQISF